MGDVFRGQWKVRNNPAEQAEHLRAHSEIGWNVMMDGEERSEETNVFDESKEEWGSTREVLKFASNPVGLFFYFMPKSFWKQTAVETNMYELETRPARIRNHKENYSDSQHNKYLDKTKKIKDIKPHELLQWICYLHMS